jgi:hypothetical protein
VTKYLPCDIFLTRSDHFLSKLIRKCTRSLFEPPSLVNHVGMVVLREGGKCMVIEARFNGVVHRPFDKYVDGKTRVVVYRPTNWTKEDKGAILAEMYKDVGEKYGYGKVVTAFLDWGLSRVFSRLSLRKRNLNVFLFRRISRNSSRPICSYLIAKNLSKRGFHFGVRPLCATPDDIDDFCRKTQPDKYITIKPLGLLALEDD